MERWSGGVLEWWSIGVMGYGDWGIGMVLYSNTGQSSSVVRGDDTTYKTPSPHHSNTPLLHHSIAPPLHCSITPSLS